MTTDQVPAWVVIRGVGHVFLSMETPGFGRSLVWPFVACGATGNRWGYENGKRPPARICKQCKMFLANGGIGKSLEEQ
jgi:hypothetical protein